MKLFRYLNNLIAKFATNYWAIPSMFLFGAFLLFCATMSFDVYFENNQYLNFISTKDADSIKVLLSTIATSIMTVTGVSFSMTLLATAHASSQIGPRLLSGFLDDRGNQVTLGILTGCFVFCVLTLGFVKGGDNVDNFIPKLSLIASTAWSIAAVFSFIYFIHHVPAMIRTTNAVSRVGTQLITEIENYFSHPFFHPHKPMPDLSESSHQTEGIPIFPRSKGYLRYIDFTKLVECLSENQCHLKFECRIGDFVIPHRPIAKLYCEKRHSKMPNQVLNFVSIGREKSIYQDFHFGFLLISEIGARALSPGINDPFTFKECIDQIEAAIFVLAEKSHRAEMLYDQSGAARLQLVPFEKREFVETLIAALEYYAKDDPYATPHLQQFKSHLKTVEI